MYGRLLLREQNPITLGGLEQPEGSGGSDSDEPDAPGTNRPRGPQDEGVANLVDKPLSLHSVVVATPEQVSCALGEESAILNMKNSVYYGMNAVGTRVWNLLGEPKSIVQLRDTLLDEYEVEPARCEQDLLQLLEQMRTEGLIEVRTAAAL
jgi:coenzyme PQQ synthesis protein D (PqqD)